MGSLILRTRPLDPQTSTNPIPMSQRFPQCTGICANGTRCTRQASHFRDISGRCGTHHRMWLAQRNTVGVEEDLRSHIDRLIRSQETPVVPVPVSVPVPVPVPAPESDHEVDPANECSICYGEICMPITCPNGHRVCGQHYQDDIASMCRQRRDNHIKCFLCRERIESTQFDLMFITTLPAAYLKSFPRTISPAFSEFMGKSMVDMLKMLNYVE